MSVENLPEHFTELTQQLEPMGPIATMITRTLKAVFQPEEHVLLHFYQLQSSETQAEGQRSTFGSLDLRVLTNSRLLTFGFFPTYHQVDAKDVHKIAHFSMINRFATGYEGEGDATSAEERGYQPLEIAIEIHLQDEFGQEVTVWNQEASRPEDIRTLFRQLPILSKISGQALAHCRA